MSKRAERRHHLNRIKEKVKSYYGGYASKCTKNIGRLANTRTPCSCYMCCNPRSRGEITRQEKVQELRESEERFYEDDKELLP